MMNENFASVELPSDKTWSAWGLMAVLGTRGPCCVRRGFRNSTGARTGVPCRLPDRRQLE
jgi:hypothetical protein